MKKEVLVEVSARHVHLSKEHLNILFGKGYELNIKKMLSQPGQYAAEERVTVVGPKRSLARVIVLGPVRDKTQVELSMTDARSIGITAPIRESGKLEGSAACRLIGPVGEVKLEEGVIIAKRHVHITPEDAEKYQVKDQEIVAVKINTPERSAIFSDVVVRVKASYATAMHIDTDEGNAANVSGIVYGEIV